MKVWFEAVTGKQALLFHFLAEKFEMAGHNTYFTIRDYDYVKGNLDRFRKNYYVVGKYGGANLTLKLLASCNRMVALTKLATLLKPDLAISFCSPDATRVAFGLKVPILALTDTPYSEAALRLTISLSKALVVPQCTNPQVYLKYGNTEIFPYNGIDEALWVKPFVPDKSVLKKLNILPNSYIVMRCEESKASYFQRLYNHIKPGASSIPAMLSQFSKKGINFPIVVFPRYPEQHEEIKKLKDSRIIIANQSLDSLSLLYFARVVITGGGTMGREGAMLGTPTIYTFPRELENSTYLKNLGFPIFHFPNLQNISEKVEELINTPSMNEKKRIAILNTIETPYEGISKALKLFV